MDHVTKLEIYQAQTQNVRMIGKARVQINRAINLALRRSDTVAVQVQTKVFALVFCAWVEANFSKVIHTPYGFTLDEIRQIKETYKANGLEKGWEKCIELGLSKIANRKQSNYLPNIRQTLKRLVTQCVFEPSLIRNKVAHGQWEIALNRENTSVNKDLSKQLVNLDVVSISIWFDSHRFLAEIIEALIESPNRTFHRDYWMKITELEDFLEKSKGWSLKNKIQRLKPIKTPVPS